MRRENDYEWCLSSVLPGMPGVDVGARKRGDRPGQLFEMRQSVGSGQTILPGLRSRDRRSDFECPGRVVCRTGAESTGTMGTPEAIWLKKGIAVGRRLGGSCARVRCALHLVT